MASRGKATATSAFGSGRRESHDSTDFYSRFTSPFISRDETVNSVRDLGDGCIHGDSRDMHHIPDSSVALVVTVNWIFLAVAWARYKAGIAGLGKRIATNETGIAMAVKEDASNSDVPEEQLAKDELDGQD